jgi:ketosteroid isomerase-like protein
MTVISELKQLHPAWAAAFNSSDINAMLELAETDQVFVPAPGAALQGDAAKGALEQFLSLGLPISMTVRHAFESGDIGLVIVDWAINGTAADGSTVALAGATADVARRGEAGWKFVIDNPFGTA